jgi:hypothetical protein
VIRSLASDELPWFLASSYTFLEHSDPWTLARKATLLLRDSEVEAERCFVLFASGTPVAGAYVLAPDPNDEDQNLYLSNLWYSRDESDLVTLLKALLHKHPHEAAHYPLYNLPPQRLARLTPHFHRLGFALERAYDLSFPLAELPPLGRPLVLEAWSPESDAGFKEVYASAEGETPSDKAWAYLKRWRGKFTPDLWFVGRETLDQPPVGYAFFGMHKEGVDGVYYLAAAGVLQRYRTSTEMLRRLVLSSMLELASRSPLGAIRTTLLGRDPKLVEIFASLGFEQRDRYLVFTKLPR